MSDSLCLFVREMSPKLTLNHFSHQHPLHLSNYEETQKPKTPISCSACNLNASGWICSCSICNYILHFECATAPHQIHLPFHPNHAFSLQHKHQNGILINCYACGYLGDGFSYSCTSCKIDLHFLCATAPQVLHHKSHNHSLELITSGTKKFTCRICRRYSNNHWFYQCHTCHKFEAHVTCTTPPPLFAVGPVPTFPEQKKDLNILDPLKETKGSSSRTTYTMSNGEKKKISDMTQDEKWSLWNDFWATRGFPKI